MSIGPLTDAREERIARRTAELVLVELRRDSTAAPNPTLVDVRTLAARLGVSADFVRERANQLGGFRITDAPRAPWRFELEVARERLAAASSGEGSRPAPTRGTRSAPRRGGRPSLGGRSLAIRG